MKTINKNQFFYCFGEEGNYRLWVDPGEHFLAETLDARQGRLQHHDQLFSTAPDWTDPFPKTNPCTGPIGVRSIRAGDTIKISVHSIALEPRGFLIHKNNMGICKQLVQETCVVFATVGEQTISLDCGVSIPVRPHIGTLGVSPTHKKAPTAFAGTHGGNLDCRFLEPGSALFLPVQVDGAALGVGDVHASMGAGELMGTGVEICATVELSVERAEHLSVMGPVLCTKDAVMTIASADQLQEALETASAAMVDLLCRYGGVSQLSAFSLLTSVCDAGICQSFDASIFSVASVSIPRCYLAQFTPAEDGVSE